MHYSPTNLTGNPILAENYTSIADAYQKIATFAPQQGQQATIPDYLDAVSYKDEADNWQPIRSLLESPIEQS